MNSTYFLSDCAVSRCFRGESTGPITSGSTSKCSTFVSSSGRGRAFEGTTTCNRTTQTSATQLSYKTKRNNKKLTTIIIIDSSKPTLSSIFTFLYNPRQRVQVEMTNKEIHVYSLDGDEPQLNDSWIRTVTLNLLAFAFYTHPALFSVHNARELEYIYLFIEPQGSHHPLPSIRPSSWPVGPPRTDFWWKLANNTVCLFAFPINKWPRFN